MKKIIKLLLVLFTLNSCISLHNGQFHNSTILTEANFKYKKQNAFGTSSTFNFLGLITDIDTKSLIGQAKADLYNYYKIEDYQTISNVTVNFKTTFFLFGVFSKTDCVFSADIIEFNRDFEKEIEIIENNEEDYDKNNNFVIKHDTLIIKEMNQNTLVNMNTDSLQIAPKIEQLVVKKSLGDYTVDNKVSFYTDIVIGGEKRKRYIKEAIVTDILNDTLIITDRTRNHNIVYKFQISEFKSDEH